jgi:hypothetical protein
LAPRRPEQARGFDHQERPKALAAAKAGVPHRLEKARRPRDLSDRRRWREEALQQALGFDCRLMEAPLKSRLDIEPGRPAFTVPPVVQTNLKCVVRHQVHALADRDDRMGSELHRFG